MCQKTMNTVSQSWLTIILMSGLLIFSDTYSIVTTIKSTQEFDSTIQEPAVVIKFFTTWCGACSASSPQFKALSDESAMNSITFAEVDVDQLSSVGQKYTINAIPTFGYFSNGELLGTLVGPNMNQLKKDINTYFSAHKNKQLVAQANTAASQEMTEEPSDSFISTTSNFFKKTWDSVQSFTRNTLDKISSFFSRS